MTWNRPWCDDTLPSGHAPRENGAIAGLSTARFPGPLHADAGKHRQRVLATCATAEASSSAATLPASWGIAGNCG